MSHPNPKQTKKRNPKISQLKKNHNSDCKTKPTKEDSLSSTGRESKVRNTEKESVFLYLLGLRPVKLTLMYSSRIKRIQFFSKYNMIQKINRIVGINRSTAVEITVARQRVFLAAVQIVIQEIYRIIRA